MAIDRTRAFWLNSGLAAAMFFPLRSDGAEMKRLPPIEFDGTNAPAANQLIPLRPPLLAPKVVSQSVWLQAAGDPANKTEEPRPVKLVNWNEDPVVPPVYVEGDGTESSRRINAQLISQPIGLSALASRAASSSTQPPPAPDAPATAQPIPEAAASPAAPPVAESIEPGTVAVNPDDGTDCAARCDVCLPPCWYVQADAMMLWRSDVRTIKIVEEGTGTPPRGQRDALLTTDELDPGTAWGPRITIGHYLNECRTLEMTYFGLNHWQSTAAFDGVNGVGFSFNNIDVPFNSNYTSDWDGAQFVSATYASEIQNAELNLLTNNRWDLNRTWDFPWYNYVDFLAGVRYFRLSEQFDLQSTDAGDTSNYLIDTTNDLIGAQVGMISGTYCSERVSWRIVSKAGMYVNVAEQSTLLRDDNNSVLLRDFNTQGDELAFIGDTHFSLAYDIRPNLALTAGYYLMYVGGVALAPEQLDFSTTPTSGSGLNQNGSAFYHGALFGLRWTF